jgi:hypothetical protein
MDFSTLSLHDRSQKSPIPAKRIQNIVEYMTFEVFKYSVRGFYEADKMTFTLLLALKVDMQAGKIKREEFMTFIKGAFTPQSQLVTIYLSRILLRWSCSGSQRSAAKAIEMDHGHNMAQLG